jgi:hypothetical protein
MAACASVCLLNKRAALFDTPDKFPWHRVYTTPQSRIFLQDCTGAHGADAAEKLKEIYLMTDYRVAAGEAQEDQVTAAIEKYTAQVPSSVYLGAAILSIIGSIAFQTAKKQHEALFIGQWVAPFLLLGLYNKMVKQHGSDATTRKG